MCGEVCVGGGGRWGDEGGMCVGEVGTVPAAGIFVIVYRI